jgi:hypothetical protein
MPTTRAVFGQATVTLGHVPPALIAVVLETVGAAWFLAFMLAESWIVLLALLAFAAAALVLVQRHRALERMLQDCLRRGAGAGLSLGGGSGRGVFPSSSGATATSCTS